MDLLDRLSPLQKLGQLRMYFENAKSLFEIRNRTIANGRNQKTNTSFKGTFMLLHLRLAIQQITIYVDISSFRGFFKMGE